MGIPQIIMIIIMSLNLLICANKHGQPKDNWHIGKHIIDLSVVVALLFWGGFFG